ncbi:ferric-dicitrate binding protein FerR (iron transport regulator) [Flavobacterium gossypii]|uniref:Ferric-dicitrate binding protein FerR (Iron transport regulator) n=1 Tax=Flavobacterium gossypii TaxID=1646119 RepID=A0ABR6DM47_9FLAO|nr:FecR family protein [Flavobacterium gossypii]MBA9072544.1 ferric-dicitrate binding protein FerR (iron transport regulator) [Flavobacterium gossypii]
MENNFDLAKWLAGEMTADELEAFEKSPEFNTYKKIKELSSQMEALAFDAESSYQNIMGQAKEKPVVRLRNNWFLKAAAILVIALGTLFILKHQITSTEYAKAGEKTTFLLPDDSEIALNSDSEIRYKKWNWSSNRSLDLKGEAFFKVAKGKKFDVNTSLGTVTVVGTQFNVRARNTNFEVECYEGKVKVAFNNKILFLEKGSSVIVRSGKQLQSLPLTTDKPSWLLNELKLNAAALNEAISEIERQYAVEIEHSKISSDQYFTGILPLDNIDTALEILCKTYHLDYTKTSDKKITLIKE